MSWYSVFYFLNLKLILSSNFAVIWCGFNTNHFILWYKPKETIVRRFLDSCIGVVKLGKKKIYMLNRSVVEETAYLFNNPTSFPGSFHGAPWPWVQGCHETRCICTAVCFCDLLWPKTHCIMCFRKVFPLSFYCMFPYSLYGNECT